MNEIIVNRISAGDALALKADLDRDGLVVNVDYTWRFQPVKYSTDFSMYEIEQSQVRFEFIEAAMASFYRIKWAK